MGKAQSKRSVDITTETKKDGIVEEGTGKMEKIEDVDQLKPQVNGDTHHNDAEIAQEKEKTGETEGTENEKDMSTEKDQKPQTAESGASGDAAAAIVPAEKPAENGSNDETLNESKNIAETSAVSETGESSKKSKKEKVKKKWSFRSISFGKKDKQKPSKKEEGTTAAAASTTATNGECEKVPEETAEETAATPQLAETKAEETVVPTIAEEKATTVEVAIAEVANPQENNTETSPAVNGASEPAKEEILADKIETAAAQAAETNKIEAAPEPVTNGTTSDIEKPITIEPTATVQVVVDDAPKLNGSSESPKIEVKTEIQCEQSSISTTTADEKDAQNKDKDEQSGDNNDKLAQNLPPPPLPCNPPPSQVMVFALSDDKAQGQQIVDLDATANEDKTIEVSPVTETIKDDIKIEDIQPTEVQITPPTPEGPKDEIENENLSDIKTEDDLQNITSDTAREEEKLESKIETETECIIVADSQPQEENKPEDNQEAKPTDILPEQIEQTIALIDEVTQQAAAITEQKMEEALIIMTNDAEETSCNSPPTINDVPKDPSETETSKQNTQLPLPPSPTEETTDSTNTEQESTAEKSRTEEIGDHKDETKTETEIKAVDENKAITTEIPIEHHPVADVPKADMDIEKNGGGEIASTNGDAKESDQKVSNTKENGVGENHEQNAETSATESLNGGVEHKTIEEMKAEHVDKIAATEVTQEAAIVSE